jgi:hypothetical protein
MPVINTTGHYNILYYYEYEKGVLILLYRVSKYSGYSRNIILKYLKVILEHFESMWNSKDATIYVYALYMSHLSSVQYCQSL